MNGRLRKQLFGLCVFPNKYHKAFKVYTMKLEALGLRIELSYLYSFFFLFAL